MRNDKLDTIQFFIYYFYDFMFFTDLDNSFTRSRALGWLFDPALQFTVFQFIYVFSVSIFKIINATN